MWIKTLFIRTGKSLSKDELFPNTVQDMSSFKSIEQVFEHCKQMVKDGVKSGMTEAETQIVQDEVTGLLGSLMAWKLSEFDDENWFEDSIGITINNTTLKGLD